MKNICPYCCKRFSSSEDTSDHIFPEFLGGRTTILACRDCNSKFGYGFEAKVSSDLSQLTVVLARCGLKPLRVVAWKRAFRDSTTGLEYDLDTAGRARLSRPMIERGSQGKIKRATFPMATLLDAKRVERHADTLKRKGLAKEVRITRLDLTFKQPPLNPLRLNIGPELRRLAVKMCAGITHLCNADNDTLEDGVRIYLLNPDSNYVPVRMAFFNYEVLEKLRPSLSHAVYIEGDSQAKRSYGVVQLYGAIQLYVVLNREYTGQSFSKMGFLDTRSGKEKFRDVAPLNLPEAPQQISVEEYRNGITSWLDKVNSQVRTVFGCNVLVVRQTDWQS